jgi:hypothetical protein
MNMHFLLIYFKIAETQYMIHMMRAESLWLRVRTTEKATKGLHKYYFEISSSIRFFSVFPFPSFLFSFTYLFLQRVKRWLSDIIITVSLSASVSISLTIRHKMLLYGSIFLFSLFTLDFGTTFSGTCYSITGKFSKEDLKNKPYVEITHVTDW